MKWDSKVYIVGLVIYLLSAIFFLLGDTGSLGPFLVEYIVLVPLLALVFSLFRPYSVYNIIIILLGIGVIGDIHRHGPAFFGVFFCDSHCFVWCSANKKLAKRKGVYL